MIEIINRKIKESNKSKNIQIKFNPEENNEILKFLQSIKLFGNIIIEGPIFIDSLIIKNNDSYIKNLIKWINSEKTFRTKLLYRKSSDGDSYEIFHNLCNNQGTTLTLIKSSEGFIIGGYTPLDWDNYTCDWKKDDNTFLFSLTKQKVFYKTSKSSYSIYCAKNMGPWFPFIGFRTSGKKI